MQTSACIQFGEVALTILFRLSGMSSDPNLGVAKVSMGFQTEQERFQRFFLGLGKTEWEKSLETLDTLA